MSGWYKMHRGWMSKPAFRNNNEKIAWIWLIEHAAIEPTMVSIQGNPVQIERGQLSYSYSYMAKAWGVSVQTARTILNHLKKWQMLNTQSNKGQLIITICEYSTYQDKQQAPNKAQDENPTANQQALNNNNKNKRIKEERNNIPPKPPKEKINKPDDVTDQVWKDFVEHRRKKKASISDTVLSRIRNEAQKAGWSLDEALAEICAKGWQGFKADWVTKGQKDERDNKSTARQRVLARHGARIGKNQPNNPAGGASLCEPSPLQPDGRGIRNTNGNADTGATALQHTGHHRGVLEMLEDG